MSEIYSPLTLQTLSLRCIVEHDSDQLKRTPLKQEIEELEKFNGRFQVMTLKMELFKTNGE